MGGLVTIRLLCIGIAWTRSPNFSPPVERRTQTISSRACVVLLSLWSTLGWYCFWTSLSALTQSLEKERRAELVMNAIRFVQYWVCLKQTAYEVAYDEIWCPSSEYGDDHLSIPFSSRRCFQCAIHIIAVRMYIKFPFYFCVWGALRVPGGQEGPEVRRFGRIGRCLHTQILDYGTVAVMPLSHDAK